MRVIDVREQSKFDWFLNLLYFHCDWSKFDKLSCEIKSRNAPWIKNSKTWRFWLGLCKVRTGWRRMADGGWRMADDKMWIEKCGW